MTWIDLFYVLGGRADNGVAARRGVAYKPRISSCVVHV